MKLEILGNAYWAKVYEPDSYNGNTFWSINVYFGDDKEKEKFISSGSRLKLRSDENGEYVTFKRDHRKKIKNNLVQFSGPTIKDNKGEAIVSYKKNAANNAFERVGDPVLIGNGSTVKVTADVYDSTMGKGTRLEEVQIIDLIEYEGNTYEDSIVVEENMPETPWD